LAAAEHLVAKRLEANREDIQNDLLTRETKERSRCNVSLRGAPSVCAEAVKYLKCQSALNWDPLSASRRDPFERRVLAGRGLIVCAAFEAPAVVTGLDDVGQAIEQRCGHIGVCEDARPFAESQIRDHDD
jgi:hypothetical protein